MPSSISRFQAAWILFYKHRHLREFGLLPSDATTWWKAGLGLAAATAFGFIVVKVFNTTDKVR